MPRARGYRREIPADIPATGRKSTAARVQEKISRGYTRNRPEKYRRAGTGEKFPRIYPRPAVKAPPRGYSQGRILPFCLLQSIVDGTDQDDGGVTGILGICNIFG